MSAAARFSPGAKHTGLHPWNTSAQGETKRYRAIHMDRWLPLFRNAEVGCAFSVRASNFMPHAVARLVGELEHELDCQIVFSPGYPYRFMRIS